MSCTPSVLFSHFTKKRASVMTLIDSRIRVWWTEEKAWYAGRVISVGRGASGRLHTIAYDDGVQATHYLQSAESALNETWETEPSPECKTPTLARGPAKGARKKRAAPASEEGKEQTDAAEATVRQAEAERLTLQPSGKNVTGYRGVYVAGRSRMARVRRAGKRAAVLVDGRTAAHAAGYKSVPVMGQRYQARVRVTRAGKGMHLGCFGTAEEAALAVARVTDARTPAPAAAPRVAAAKRTAPPPPKSPAPANKQPRNTLTLRPIKSVALPAAPALGATVGAAPAIFKDKLALLKRVLDIKPAIPAIPAIAEANELLGITPSGGDSLGAQLDTVLAAISC